MGAFGELPEPIKRGATIGSFSASRMNNLFDAVKMLRGMVGGRGVQIDTRGKKVRINAKKQKRFTPNDYVPLRARLTAYAPNLMYFKGRLINSFGDDAEDEDRNIYCWKYPSASDDITTMIPKPMVYSGEPPFPLECIVPVEPLLIDGQVRFYIKFYFNSTCIRPE